ncbi:lytic transglycosylase domain-containing protein [Rheinheimera sp. MMS21-TC3]|uniref:lytic transglycosylase domain-containing protein n=1 Tax=Rheinheimera sp. MMS21-TC3 TaxID=3072790 RepID=UPI0028C4BF98|nr:lytic transglycosylase domain-containing protein [Rheinheimera sp. MMS21-TC3]WNO62293.1 lytic transglycosylase domain-containing protein [Rheinheimera sp. MMS21-TC3]
MLFGYLALLAVATTSLMLQAKEDKKPVHKLSPSKSAPAVKMPSKKSNSTAQYTIYSAQKADGTVLFSDRQPLNLSYKVLYYDCFACDPNSNINWFTTPLYIRPYNQLINSAAIKHNLDPALIRAVIHAESAFRPSVVSKKGAVGLMQLMPKTAEELGVTDASMPSQNIQAGSQYLAKLLQQYDNNIDLALAAYNAGSTAVRRHQGIPPFAETQAYVKRVNILHKRYQSGF